jgi:hypothetical protein
MELFKIQRGNVKKFYESKESFDRFWPTQLRYSKHYDVVAFKLDWKEREWKCIRRVGPKIGYYSS